MREEADDRCSLLQLFPELGNRRQRFGVGVIQVEDDERRLLVAIGLQPLEDVLVRLDELDFDIEFAGGFLNFREEEQVVDEGKDAGSSILVQFADGLRIGLDISAADSAATSSALIADTLATVAVTVI